MPEKIPPRKGVLVLSMARSGSSWLGSISNKTGVMGVSSEWLEISQQDNKTAQAFFDYVMRESSTENGRFSIKIFPRHLRETLDVYDFDFIKKCYETYDCRIVLLTRENRIEQAISMVRARQSHQWKRFKNKEVDATGSLKYDFEALCTAYFHIGRAFEFWRTYLQLNNMPYDAFSYEMLLQDPALWFNGQAQHLDVEAPRDYQTDMLVQRDNLTLEWQERFAADIKEHGVPAAAFQPVAPVRSLANALRVYTGSPIQFPYDDLKN